MGRPKTLIKWKKFTKIGSMTTFKKQPREYNPTKDLLDEKLIAKAIKTKANLQKSIIYQEPPFTMHLKVKIPHFIL